MSVQMENIHVTVNYIVQILMEIIRVTVLVDTKFIVQFLKDALVSDCTESYSQL